MNRPDIRWQLLLAVSGFAVVVALLSFQVQSAALCTETIPSSGGNVTIGLVGRPVTLNPLLSDGFPIDNTLNDLIYDGLTVTDRQGMPQPALAESWSYSDDGLTMRVTLRDDALWHDGQPVTTSDVAFTYGLLQDPSFAGDPGVAALWQTVTITVIDDRTIEFALPQPFAPFAEALTRGILPAHLLGDLTAADLAASEFNQSPVGTGPFRVAPGQSWVRTGQLNLLPNPDYWQDPAQIAGVTYQFLPDDRAMLEGFNAGQLLALEDVAPVLAPEVAVLESIRLFSDRVPRYSALLFNLSAEGAPGISDLAVRQSLAQALDREALVDAVLNGQGIVFEGPYLPESWVYSPQHLTVYESQPLSATVRLEESGWTLPDGGQVRQANGQPLMLRLVTLDDPTQMALAEAIAQQWRSIGVGVETNVVADPTALRETLAARAFDVALVDIVPPGDPDLYDFWSQEAIVRGQNYAGWNNRRASEALESGRQLLDPAARLPHYEAFLRQFDADLPALTLYQHVQTVGVSESIEQVEIGRLDRPRDLFRTLPQWFMLYRDVTVVCPPSG